MLSSNGMGWLWSYISLYLICVVASRPSTDDGSSSPQYQILPPLRVQNELYNAWRAERRAGIPALLQKHNVSAWLMSQREYAEDTAFWSLKSGRTFSARRRTVFAFFAEPSSAEANQTAYMWIDNTQQVWSELRDVLAAHDPASIALNIDAEVSFSSGLHAGEYALLLQQLGSHWSKRVVSKPIVAVEYIATLPEAQFIWYKAMMETAWAMISEAFSERVITPGETSTEDVEWWLRDKLQALNYTTWFQGDVSVLKPNSEIGPQPDKEPSIINYGDLLHVDFGVTALGMNTDTQHLAYVLYPGETEDDIPQGYKDGLKTGNRLQDIVRTNMMPGLSGNQVLERCLHQMSAEGINGRVYSHPIGDWGHSAGAVVGMANLPVNVPVLGDLPILTGTYYSVELYAEHFVAEQNATMKFYLEEDVAWDHSTQSWEWVYGQQKKLHLVRSPEKEGERALKIQP